MADDPTPSPGGGDTTPAPVTPAPATTAPEWTSPGRLKIALVAVPIAVLVVMTNIADALTTTWAEDHPLALTALSARNRILVLTTNNLDATSYYVVATLRLLAADPPFFLLGRWYGERALTWVEARSPMYGEFLRKVEQAFGKAAYPLVFLAPNNYICLIAGASGMGIGIFLALNIAGTVVRLVLIRITGAAFESPIQGVLDLFAEYRVPFLVLSIALVVLSVVIGRRKGGGELGVLKELGDAPGGPHGVDPAEAAADRDPERASPAEGSRAAGADAPVPPTPAGRRRTLRARAEDEA